MKKLPYLDSIGISGGGQSSVWLSPFYEFGGVDMGYDVVNHTKVDPRFGTEQDLDDLLNAFSERGWVMPSYLPNNRRISLFANRL